MIYSLPVVISLASVVASRAVVPRATDFSGGTGQGTYYNTGLTSCGKTYKDTDLVVALSQLFYDTYPGATANPNTNPVCGKKLTAQYKGKSVTVTVADRCTACKMYDLDFTPTAFKKIADMSVGRIDGVTWKFDDAASNSTTAKPTKTGKPKKTSKPKKTHGAKPSHSAKGGKTSAAVTASATKPAKTSSAAVSVESSSTTTTSGTGTTDGSADGDSVTDGPVTSADIDPSAADITPASIGADSGSNSTTTVTGTGATLNSTTTTSPSSPGAGSVTHLTGDGAVLNATTNSTDPDGSTSHTTTTSTETHLHSTTHSNGKGKGKKRAIWVRDLA